MARQVLPVVGAVIGGYFGGPQGAQIGFAIGSLVGNAVDPLRVKVPGIKDIPTQDSGEGGFRQVVYGTCWVNSTNLIDFSDVRRVTQRERQGKGGGPVVESERLYRTYAVGLGEPLEAIRVIRRDGKIVYDVRPGSAILSDSSAFASRFRFYSGSETQTPDPDLEAIHGVGNTPAYRGTAYLVFPNDDLTDTQGRIPTYEVEGVIGGEFLNDVALITNRNYYSGNPGALQVEGAIPFHTTTAEVALSPSGIYAVGFNTEQLASSTFVVAKFDQAAQTWSAISNPPGLTSGFVQAAAWSPDSQYLALSVTSSPYIQVFKRAGDAFTLLASPAEPIVGVTGFRSICWDSEGQRLAISVNGADQIAVYDFVSDALVNKRTPTGYFPGTAPEFMEFEAGLGSRYLFCCDGGSRISVMRCEESPMELAVRVTGGGQRGVFYDASGGYLLCVNSGSPTVITVYQFSPSVIGTESMTLVSTYTTGLPANLLNAAISFDRRHIALAKASGQLYPTIVAVSATTPPTLSTLANPADAPDGVNAVAFLQSSPFAVITAGQIPLSAVLEDVCERCGLSAGELDMSPLDSVAVDGVTLGGGYTGADACLLFMPAYFFDLTQPDKALKAVVRGGASAAAVTADNFVDEPDENILRGQDIEYPRQIMLKYLNPAQNYAAPAAVVSRTSPDIRVRGEAGVELPISFDETGAIRVADRMLKVIWEDLNGELTFSLPSGPFAWLAPTDILTLSLRGGVYRVRVEKIEEAQGVLKVTARRDRQSAYTSNLTAPSLPPPTTPPPAQPGDTEFVVMNLPALTDGEDALGVYIAMTGAAGTAWSGAQIAYRVQGNAEWTVIGSYTTRAVMGQLTAGLSAASPHYTDTTNPLAVSLVLDTDNLEAITQNEFLSEGNPAVIVYPDYTGEVIQFRDVVDNGSGAWTLSTLQRGRLNTDTDAHLSGARFAMLDGAIFLPLPTAVIGQTLEFRVTSLGTSPETAPTQTLVWVPQLSQYEFPPAFLSLERAGGVISGNWSPRHRFGTDVVPVASINFTGYQVTLTDGTVTNTFTVIDPEFSVSDAAYSGVITVSVSQINRYTGAGPSISEAI